MKFSEDFVNLNHVKHLEDKTQKLKNALVEIEKLKQKNLDNIEKYSNQMRDLNEQLLSLSEDNDLLKKELTTLEHEKKVMIAELYLIIFVIFERS